MSNALRRWLNLGTLMALALAGCGSDGGNNVEELNLEEIQIGALQDFSDLPSVAMGPDGRFAVAWRQGVSGIPQSQSQLQRFTANGFKDGPVVVVGSYGAPLLAFGPRGESFVAWDPFDVYVQRYAADGSPLGAASLVHPGTLGMNGFDFGAGGQGVVLTGDCIEDCSRSRYAVTRLVADGSAEGPERIYALIPGTSDGETFTAVMDNGSFVILWNSSRPGQLDTQIQRFGADGTPVGAVIHVNANPVGVRAVPGGGFVAVWNAAAGGVEGQRHAADGSPLGGRFTVPGSGVPGGFSVGPDGRMVILLRNGGSITARRLGADGTPLGPEIPVFSGTQTSWRSVSVALGPRGRFFVAWRNQSGQLRGRLFAE